jgi:hypothetical protein
MTAQQLRRLESVRRHPVLLALPQTLVIERGDEPLDQSDKLLGLARGRAERRVDEQRRRTARQRRARRARPTDVADPAGVRRDR